ncbi:MAG TPA: CoA-binding protein [Beijerinckiaceae bacterium]|nr:CoA-binding protein [Beijerinckiaceae bacterium]
MATTDPALEPLFGPASIVVAGASNTPGKMGNMVARRLREGFRGRLAVVNPGEREVAGIASLPSVAEVPWPVDVLLALLPGPALVELLEDCPAGKVRFVVAVPSGFGEVAGGGPLQERLKAAVARMGATLLGPNIVGIMNCAAGVNASIIPLFPPGGAGLSCLTQSGGFGMALAMYANDHAVPVAKFCDLGNMAGLAVEQVLAFYGDDPQTRVVGLFLEAVANPDRFLEVAGEVACRKPVVLSVLGRTEAGRRASRAHLGLESNVARLVERLPPGVVLAETGQDLLDAAKALLWQPPPAGRRLAVVTGTGGIGSELADLAVQRGLVLPEASPGLQARMRAHLPAFAGAGNPVDATPIWWDYPKVYPALVRALQDSGEYDLVLVSITDVPTTFPDLAEALAALAPDLDKPVCVFWGARDQDLESMRRLQAAGLPCYRTTRAAATAAAALAAGAPA